ncbi:MAG: response regulator [Chitinophagaceae bacterium]|nr:response regulator [Chitinophagaceae bacterium]
MKILIVDSSAWIPDRIASLLTETEKENTLYKALTYKEAISLFHEAKPAVVILDKSLPDNGSISLLKDIKSAKKETMVIVLSLRIDQNTEQQCKLAGADFFLDKYNEFEKIPPIIDSIESEINAQNEIRKTSK